MKNPCNALSWLLIGLVLTGPVFAQNPDSDSTENAVLPYGLSDQTYEARKAAESSPFDQTNPVKLFMVALIRVYQKVFSELDGPTCQFRPSCSHFGASAIKHHGPIQGLFMTGDRILRCHPFTYGMYPLTEDRLHHADPPGNHTLISGQDP